MYEDLRTADDSEVLCIQSKGHTEKDSYVKVSPAVGNMIRDYLKVRFKGKEPKKRYYLSVSTSRNHAKFDTDALNASDSCYRKKGNERYWL